MRLLWGYNVTQVADGEFGGPGSAGPLRGRKRDIWSVHLYRSIPDHPQIVITSPSQLCGQNPSFGADIDRIPRVYENVCIAVEYPPCMIRGAGAREWGGWYARLRT